MMSHENYSSLYNISNMFRTLQYWEIAMGRLKNALHFITKSSFCVESNVSQLTFSSPQYLAELISFHGRCSKCLCCDLSWVWAETSGPHLEGSGK